MKRTPFPMVTGRKSGQARARRGAMLLWSVAALGLAVVMAPLYVSLCGSLSRLTARNAHRLLATQRGSAELERLREGPGSDAGAREFAVLELPSGRGTMTLAPAAVPGLREARLVIYWDEGGVRARAEWTTLVPPSKGEGGA